MSKDKKPCLHFWELCQQDAKNKHEKLDATTFELHFSRFLFTWLPDEDLQQLVEDILREDCSPLRPMFACAFQQEKQLSAVCFHYLLGALEKNKQIAKRLLLDPLFSEALNLDKHSSEKLLHNVMALVAVGKAGLSDECILEAIETKTDLPALLQVKLLGLLPRLQSSLADDAFWQKQREKIPRQPLLGLALIDAFKNNRPFVALRVLLDYNHLHYRPSEEELSLFDDQLEISLANALEKGTEEDYRNFLQLESELIQPWAKELLGFILYREFFEDVKQKLDTLPKKIQEVQEHTISKDAKEYYETILKESAQKPVLEKLSQQPEMAREIANYAIRRHLVEESPVNKEALRKFIPILFPSDEFKIEHQVEGVWTNYRALELKHLESEKGISFLPNEKCLEQITEEQKQIGENRTKWFQERIAFVKEQRS